MLIAKSPGPPATLALLLALAGCDTGRPSAGQQAEASEEHGGHVIPAHMPASFPDAVRRLEALDRAIGQTPGDAKSISMATDIAGWLPDIAAESDMPEGPWQEVDRLSAGLLAGYRSMAGSPGAPDGAARDARRDVAALAAILEKSDPNWFDKPPGAPAAP